MPSSSRRPVLLVVDPTHEIAALIGRCAPESEVVAVADVGEALERLARRRGRIDMVLLPCAGRPTASELAAALGAVQTIVSAFPWVPLVALLDEECETSVLVNAVRCGVIDFLRQPLDPAEVASVLERRLGRRRQARAPAKAAARLRAVLAFLEEHYVDPVSLEALGRMAGMSRWHFSRTFRVVTGRSVRAFIMERRLARARELLEESRLSITEIAYEAGFCDLSHLDRVFRKRFGMSPSEFGRRKPPKPIRDEPGRPRRRAVEPGSESSG
jgi:AraC-like DNA-binding protein